MKKTYISIFVLLTIFALLFGGCINAADDTTNKNTGNSDGKENTGKPPINDDDNEIEAPAPVITREQNNFNVVNADDTVEVGTVAVVFTFPGTDDEYWGDTGWTLSFASGTGDTHNSKFSIGEGDNKNKILVKEELPLSVYFIRVEIKGTENSVITYSEKQRFTFDVTQTPAEFTRAPTVLPHIIGGNKNKLEIIWQARQGAAGYKVYINKENKSAGAIELPLITGGSNTNTAIDKYPGEDLELPDGTDYYIWVKAFNDSGETKFSPVKKQHTSDPIEAFWYTGNFAHMNEYYPAHKDVEGMGWDSGYDWYTIHPDPDDKGVRFIYFGGTSGEGFNNDSFILYHRRFDPIEAEAKTRVVKSQNGPITLPLGHTAFMSLEKIQSGVTYPARWLYMPEGINAPIGATSIQSFPSDVKTAALNLGYPENGVVPPSGVFIIRNSSPSMAARYPYYATFYHGMASMHPNTTNKIYIFFGNAAAGVTGMLPPPNNVSMYSETFEHALENYTVDNYNYHIAYVASPWTRRELQWVGNKTSEDRDKGFIPYP